MILNMTHPLRIYLITGCHTIKMILNMTHPLRIYFKHDTFPQNLFDYRYASFDEGTCFV
jgi:hypothetical protein